MSPALSALDPLYTTEVSPIFFDRLSFTKNLHRYETFWPVNDHLTIPTFWIKRLAVSATRFAELMQFWQDPKCRRARTF